MPKNAKIKATDAVPTRSGDAHSMARCSGFTHRSPAAVSAISGSSFATVTTSTSRAPIATPRMLINANVAKTRPSPMALKTGQPRAGTAKVSEVASALATDAAARTQDNHTRMPVRKPTSGPNATST